VLIRDYLRGFADRTLKADTSTLLEREPRGRAARVESFDPR